MARKNDQDGLCKRGDSPYWWASYTDTSGCRVRRSTGTEKQREAAALLSKWKLETYRKRNWGEQPERSFEELMVEFLGHGQAVKRPGGYGRDLLATEHLRVSFGGRNLNDITPSSVRDYIKGRRTAGVAPATINRELCVLSAALNYVRRELEWEVSNPVTGRKLRELEGRVRWMTTEEADRLIEEAGREAQAQHLPDFIRLALHTGCRKGEMLGLEWTRVDLVQRLLYLQGENTRLGNAAEFR